MNYYAFDADGNVVRSGTFQQETKHLYVDPRYTLVEGVADMNLDYVEDGKLLRYTPAQLQECSNKPGAGWVWQVATKSWLDTRTPQDHIDATRTRRNALLTASDWTQLPDVPLATKDAWAVYRQALRDITNQTDPKWPTPP